jgi:methylenetetrahydrofolate--tRNA-(uracil-5-)-methyltransferase
MKYPDQKRVFRLIPGLENAEFLKLGSIHRNLFIHTPKLLNKNLSSKHDPDLFFAGQITGVEGYFESTCTGKLAALFLDHRVNNKEFKNLPLESALGALLNAITEPKDNFQPTNINFGLFPPLEAKKADKKQAHIDRAKKYFSNWQSSTLV